MSKILLIVGILCSTNCAILCCVLGDLATAFFCATNAILQIILYVVLFTEKEKSNEKAT
jgi:hypothetical protein